MTASRLRRLGSATAHVAAGPTPTPALAAARNVLRVVILTPDFAMRLLVSEIAPARPMPDRPQRPDDRRYLAANSTTRLAETTWAWRGNDRVRPPLIQLPFTRIFIVDTRRLQ